MVKEWSIKIIPEILANLSYKIILNLYNEDKKLITEISLEMLERTSDPNIWYDILEKLMNFERTYKDCWDDWIIPEIRNRQEKDLSITYGWILYGLDCFGPGKHKDSVVDLIEEYVPRIFRQPVENLPFDLIEFIDENYSSPYSWKVIFNKLELIKELELFENYDKIYELMIQYPALETTEVKQTLIQISKSGVAKKNFDLFLRIVDDYSPTRFSISNKYEIFITDIFNEGNWTEEESIRISEYFPKVDFNIDYTLINTIRINQEIDHINKMNQLNPLYRHD